MQKRFKKSSLLKFLGHEATSEEVLHSHAYKRVESKDGPSVRPRHPYVANNKTVASYRDSMVGSTVQYKDIKPLQPSKPAAEETVNDDNGIIGNRPRSQQSDNSISSRDKADIERRHHFIEPPKRGFNRFN